MFMNLEYGRQKLALQVDMVQFYNFKVN